MRNYREVQLQPSVIKHPQFDTTTGERAYARTFAAARVTGRCAPSPRCAAVRRSATHQSTSSRSARNLLRWWLSGDPRRSSPDNAFATPNARARARAAFAAEARGADEGEAKQTSTSRSWDGELTNTSSQSISIRPIAAAADRGGGTEEEVEVAA